MRHIHLKCRNHPELRWNCKSIAVNPDGSYNSQRNIFYESDLPECSCPASDLTFADEDERQKWLEDAQS